VSQKILADIGETLVEIHSQHEQSSLFDADVQREIIDKFAGLETRPLGSAFRAFKDAEKELRERIAAIAKAQSEEDYLRHVLEELTALNPQEGEEGELADKRRDMMNYEKTATILRDAEDDLVRDKNVETALSNAQKTFIRANEPKFDKLVDCLERAMIEVGELFNEMQILANELQFNPEELGRIEERLFAIRGLARKYDCHPDQLADYRAEIEKKLGLLSAEESNLKELKAKVKLLEAEYAKIAAEISAKRKAAAQILQVKLLEELAPLAMASVRFEVQFAAQEPSANGVDKIDFIAATNPGTALRMLSDIASGGEISRFMLALKVALLGVSAAPTIIFDEIDTGTGGSVAAAIGERLARLGEGLQVFVVTHLPQVAGKAQNHLLVMKQDVKGRNITKLKTLSGDERREELARMLSGEELTEEARAQAIKLMA
jgi:DNA repair protein RecN (Recombination protein N)